MREKVGQSIKKYGLVNAGEKVLVAVSGGPDSVVLLHVLHHMSDTLGITLHVAHINHSLRPEAAAEARTVKKLALSLDLPVSVCRVNVRALQEKQGLSLQGAARVARYSALIDLARRLGATAIATAHHRDDRVETMLMRMLGGSGLDGLAGIPIRRRLQRNLFVIRPLLETTRQEIEAYCQKNRLKPVFDPSNEKPLYLRNRVRLELIPYLEKIFGRHIRRTLGATSDNLAHDAAFLQTLGRQAYAGAVEFKNRAGIMLDTAILFRLPKALQNRAVRHALWQAGVKRPGTLHVEQVLALTAHKHPAAQCTLPDGITARRVYSKLWLGTAPPPAEVSGAVTEIQVPGRTYLPCCRRRLTAVTMPVGEVDITGLKRHEACLDAEKLTGPLFARSRRDGDRMQPLGAPGSRKVKKILADRKIPREVRQRIPVITSGDDIVWLGGVEIADPYKVTAETDTVLYMKLSQIKRDGAE